MSVRLRMRIPDMGAWDDKARTRLAGLIERHPRKITQEMLAEATGWSQPNVSQYFTGKINADLDKLDAMARLLGARLTDLFAEADPKIDEVQALVASLSNGARTHLLGLLKAPELSLPATPRLPPASPVRRVGKK
jgi:transcriptional regulator with XRE-family HTH domain